jgi:hypothetical protein
MRLFGPLECVKVKRRQLIVRPDGSRRHGFLSRIQFILGTPPQIVGIVGSAHFVRLPPEMPIRANLGSKVGITKSAAGSFQVSKLKVRNHP